MLFPVHFQLSTFPFTIFHLLFSTFPFSLPLFSQKISKNFPVKNLRGHSTPCPRLLRQVAASKGGMGAFAPPPSGALPPTFPQSKGKKRAKISNFLIFAPSDTHFAPSMLPRKKKSGAATGYATDIGLQVFEIKRYKCHNTNFIFFTDNYFRCLQEADEDGGGGLDIDEFRQAMRKIMGEGMVGLNTQPCRSGFKMKPTFGQQHVKSMNLDRKGPFS